LFYFNSALATWSLTSSYMMSRMFNLAALLSDTKSD